MTEATPESPDSSDVRFNPEHIEVDALFLANSAEVREAFLYVLGGGWTRCWPGQGQAYPYDRQIPFVALFRVPYHEANIEHKFTIGFQDSDGRELGARAEGSFKIGRDVDLGQGMSQLISMAAVAGVKLDRPGIYHVTVHIDGEEKKRIAFEALLAAPKRR